MNIFKQFLTEAFDNPYRWRWASFPDGMIGNNKWIAVSNPRNIVVYIDEQDEGSYGLDFTVGGEVSKTGEGDEFRIFATVKEIVEDFIEKMEPRQISFLAFKDGESGGNRIRVYETIMKRFARGLGYRMSITRLGSGALFTLTRIR